MDKINFENATLVNPAKVTIDGEDYEVTPEETTGGTVASANTFNTMQDNIEKSVNYIGSTQPSTGEKVWFKKGKNLFDKNKVIKGCELVGGELLVNADWWASDYIPVKANIQYYKSGNITSGTALNFYDKNKNRITQTSLLTGVFTTVNDTEYIRINGLISELDEDIMIEQGETATTYEPYIEKEISVKNDNGVFEKFFNENILYSENYSLGEQRIGTWIDGKPLYRKVVNFGALPNNTSKRINHGIANANFVKIENCFMNANRDLGGIIPNGDTSNSIRYWITNNYIEVLTTSDRSNYVNCHFILEYTKTTD